MERLISILSMKLLYTSNLSTAIKHLDEGTCF